MTVRAAESATTINLGSSIGIGRSKRKSWSRELLIIPHSQTRSIPRRVECRNEFGRGRPARSGCLVRKAVADAGLSGRKIGLAIRAPACQLVEELDLMTQFRFDPAADKGQTLRTFGGFQLPRANSGGAAHAILPEAAVGVAEFIQQHNVDVVFGCQLQGVRGDRDAGRDQDSLNLVSGKADFAILGADQKTLASPAKRGAKSIDDKLHGGLARERRPKREKRSRDGE
jgi:hypothetical protein